MTWTKIGDEFLGDPVLLGLPRGIRLLSIEGTIWSNQQGTDGRIPRHMLSRLTDEPDAEGAADQLVTFGKWNATDAGWEIVGFLEDQWSAADVAASRRLAAERNRRYRWHRQGRHDLCLPGRCPNASSHASRDATPSDPSVPTDPPDREGGTVTGTKPTRSGRGPAPVGSVLENLAANGLDPRLAASFASRSSRKRAEGNGTPQLERPTPTIDCADYRGHQSQHRQGRDGSWVCLACTADPDHHEPEAEQVAEEWSFAEGSA